MFREKLYLLSVPFRCPAEKGRSVREGWNVKIRFMGGLASLLLAGMLTGCQGGGSPVASTVVPPEGLYLQEERGVPFPVSILAEEEDLLTDPMVQLTGEQRDLLARLPVEELPRDLPDGGESGHILESVTQADLWRGTLLPLAADEEADVTLYGVTAGLLEYNSPLTDGIVLRCGEKASYFPFSWGQNAWYDTDPWIAVGDYDGDGANEVAICLNLGGGTGVNAMQLYLVEPETMEYAVPDLNTMNITGYWNEEEGTVTLVPEGEEPLTAQLPPDIDRVDGMTGQLISIFTREAGRLWFETALGCGDSTFYLVQAKAPVIWENGGYRLGTAVLKLYA